MLLLLSLLAVMLLVLRLGRKSGEKCERKEHRKYCSQVFHGRGSLNECRKYQLLKCNEDCEARGLESACTACPRHGGVRVGWVCEMFYVASIVCEVYTL